jgi:L-asparaginase
MFWRKRLYGAYETSTQLKKIGLISGKDIQQKQQLQNDVFLGEKVAPNVFKTIFETSLRGEMNFLN